MKASSATRTCRFDAALASTRRQIDSRATEVLTIAVAYIIVAGIFIYVPPERFQLWGRGSGTGLGRLSLAGWWYALVSLPILLVLFLGWLWRVVHWARFLTRVAGLDLRLIAAHPVQAGGLGFLSTSLQGFRLVSLAMGAMLGGSVANLVIHYGASPFVFKRLAIGLLVSCAIIFAGPLTVFTRRLREARRHAMFEYGALATGMGTAFEARWKMRGTGAEEALAAPDFSATTDLYSIVANVHEMGSLPFALRDLVGPVGGAALPLIPVALLAFPLREIVDAAVKLLL